MEYLFIFRNIKIFSKLLNNETTCFGQSSMTSHQIFLPSIFQEFPNIVLVEVHRHHSCRMEDDNCPEDDLVRKFPSFVVDADLSGETSEPSPHEFQEVKFALGSPPLTSLGSVFVGNNCGKAPNSKNEEETGVDDKQNENWVHFLGVFCR